jgi:hypothetical protein
MPEVEAIEADTLEGESLAEPCVLCRLSCRFALRPGLVGRPDSSVSVDLAIEEDEDTGIAFLTVPSSRGGLSTASLTVPTFLTVSPTVENLCCLLSGLHGVQGGGDSCLSSGKSTTTLSSVWSPNAGGLSSRIGGDLIAFEEELENETESASSDGRLLAMDCRLAGRREGESNSSRAASELFRLCISERGRWDLICEKRDRGESRLFSV